MTSHNTNIHIKHPRKQKYFYNLEFDNILFSSSKNIKHKISIQTFKPTTKDVN